MSLFLATLLMGLLLLAKGFLLWASPKWVERVGRHFLRSNAAAFFLFGGAAVWFLWHISRLNEADFGAYRGWLLILFGAVAVMSFFYVKDFLAVRGWSVLVLLISNVLLDSAYMEEPKSRLVLVVLAYLLIVMAMYFGVVPYKVRDFYNWLFARRARIRMAANITFLYGVLLIGLALTY